MAATTRQGTKTINMASAPEDSVPEPVTQREQADSGRFRLQVDRQTKGSYATYDAAETAGTGIKKHYPILQVAVYDGVEIEQGYRVAVGHEIFARVPCFIVRHVCGANRLGLRSR
jgi:hypothetical protein